MIVYFWFAENDATIRLELLGYAKKLAHRHPLGNAFRKVIVLSLDNGKVGVEINQKDINECSLDDIRDDEINHVNYIEEVHFSDSD